MCIHVEHVDPSMIFVLRDTCVYSHKVRHATAIQTDEALFVVVNKQLLSYSIERHNDKNRLAACSLPSMCT